MGCMARVGLRGMEARAGLAAVPVRRYPGLWGVLVRRGVTRLDGESAKWTRWRADGAVLAGAATQPTGVGCRGNLRARTPRCGLCTYHLTVNR